MYIYFMFNWDPAFSGTPLVQSGCFESCIERTQADCKATLRCSIEKGQEGSTGDMSAQHNIDVYIYIYTSICFYIFVFVYIRHRALRVWSDRAQNFTFRLLLSDFLLIEYNTPPIRTTEIFQISLSPWAAFEKNCFC